MKFNNYINEVAAANWVDEIDLIKKNCKPFLDLLDDWDWKYIFTRFDVSPKFDMKTTRKNRKPVDTPKFVHDILDSLFYDKFGWKPRSEGVFTWPKDLLDAGIAACLFFPIGSFDFIWSPKIQDLYMKWRQFHDWYKGERTPEQTRAWAEKLIKTYKDMHNTSKNDNMPGHEVVFECDKYYLCNFSRYTDYTNFLLTLRTGK